jgi:hypothetical protein
VVRSAEEYSGFDPRHKGGFQDFTQSLRKIILCRVTQGKMHQLRLLMGISRMQGELEVPKIYTIFFNLFCIQDINYN